MRDRTPRIFEIDLRSLAALRIGLGALLLADLAYRAIDLGAHYTDAGVLPRVALRALLRDSAGLWSLHAASGAWAPQCAIFAVAALAAIALLVGYRTFPPGVCWEKLGLGEPGPASATPHALRRLAPVHALVVAAFALVVAENAASTVRARGGVGLPRPLRASIEALGLSQQWKLWDRPIPNRYYVFPATLRDGRQVDLHTGQPLDWDRPRRRSANNHWWKYQLHLSRPYAASLRPWYARYLAASWDRDSAPEQSVEQLELVRIHAGAPAGSPGQQRREVLWQGRPPATG